VNENGEMLKFVLMSKRTVELGLARKRAENRRRPRFQSHSWHGSPSKAPGPAAEEVNMQFVSSRCSVLSTPSISIVIILSKSSQLCPLLAWRTLEP
jgi:hypothetical protein